MNYNGMLKMNFFHMIYDIYVLILILKNQILNEHCKISRTLVVREDGLYFI